MPAGVHEVVAASWHGFFSRPVAMSNSSPNDRPSRAWKASERFVREARRIGARIRALRIARGLTLAEAAARMDVDARHLQKIEAGRLNVTLVTLVRILTGLRVPFAALCARATRPLTTRVE
jgi:DNA-binding XRE family transcriptional regulator